MLLTETPRPDLPVATSVRHVVLGVPFRFETRYPRLLDLVDKAYAGLPAHRWVREVPECLVELKLLPPRRGESPLALTPPEDHGDVVTHALDAVNAAWIVPDGRRAVIAVTPDMLERPYLVRHELIEFSVYTLATRVMGLVPLHGACVARGDRAVLLLGDSGAGKTTLAMHALLAGWDFVAEDAVFVEPHTCQVTGVGNFLHVRPEAVGRIEDDHAWQWIAESSLIRRSSGVQKHEADVRKGIGRIASRPPRVAAIVFLMPEPAARGSDLLRAIDNPRAMARIAAEQPYTARQAGWQAFLDTGSGIPAFELHRGAHAADALACVDAMLDRTQAPRHG